LKGREEVVLNRGFTLIELLVVIAIIAVHFVKDSIDRSTWAAAGTRAGGEANAFPF
jgi:prepilin-type N-terminal cleavage/methylation domain-containing protein